MDLNDWWVAALIMFVLFSMSCGSAHVDDTQSTNHEVDDDDDPYLLVLQQQEEDRLRQDWEDRQRENWGSHDD